MIALTQIVSRVWLKEALVNWYIHHMTVNGAVCGFVDEDRWVGTSPDGGPEKVSGPYSSKAEAERRLKQMIEEDRKRRGES